MSEDSRSARGQRLGPLSLLLVPALLAAFVLPSALNVNQSNPSPTLEYAPVPASDENPPPTPGNLDTLALASTTGLKSPGNGPGDGGGGGGGDESALIPPPLPELVKRVASSKTCVGTPPRQTEDPYSPPCVATFKGNNGGATHVGVTKDEVKVLFYFKAYNLGEPGTYWDLGRPATAGKVDPDVIASLRVWQQYFNQRFQAYGRFVRFIAYSGTGGDAESRRSDAAKNWDEIKPFATVIHAPNAEPYMEEMARHQVLNFTGGLDGGEYISADAYKEVRPHGWGSYASSELKAKIYASYVCRQLAGKAPTFGQVPGATRKFGLWFSTDVDFPEIGRFGEQVKQLLLDTCNVDAIPKASNKTHFTGGTANSQAAAAAAADWQRQNVTTVLHTTGEETGFTQAAGKLGYFPELVIADDHFWAGNHHAPYQDPNVMRNAVLVTDVPSFAREQDTYCYQAFKDTSPGARGAWSCYLYPSILQLMTAIQGAGPTLNPKSVDEGLHAIPAVPSKDPTTPACFYLPGDYTCIKDAVLEYWDGAPKGNRPQYDRGPCWRGVDGGARWIAGQWPAEDRVAKTDRTAGQGSCNNHTAGITPASQGLVKTATTASPTNHHLGDLG